MVQLWLKSWPRIFFQLWSRWFKCGPYVVQCGPYCGFSVVQIVVQVWSKLFTFVSGFHTYVNFFQHLVVRCGSSVVQMKMQRLTHFSCNLWLWSNCVPKWDLNVVQTMVHLWLKSWPRIIFQLWSKWFKCGPYMGQWIRSKWSNCVPKWDIMLSKLWSNCGSNLGQERSSIYGPDDSNVVHMWVHLNVVQIKFKCCSNYGPIVAQILTKNKLPIMVQMIQMWSICGSFLSILYFVISGPNVVHLQKNNWSKIKNNWSKSGIVIKKINFIFD